MQTAALGMPSCHSRNRGKRVLETPMRHIAICVYGSIWQDGTATKINTNARPGSTGTRYYNILGLRF